MACSCSDPAKRAAREQRRQQQQQARQALREQRLTLSAQKQEKVKTNG